jgi:hypothetical protein
LEAAAIAPDLAVFAALLASPDGVVWHASPEMKKKALLF